MSTLEKSLQFNEPVSVGLIIIHSLNPHTNCTSFTSNSRGWKCSGKVYDRLRVVSQDCLCVITFETSFHNVFKIHCVVYTIPTLYQTGGILSSPPNLGLHYHNSPPPWKPFINPNLPRWEYFPNYDRVPSLKSERSLT